MCVHPLQVVVLVCNFTVQYCVNGITDSMDMCLSKLWELMMDGKPGVLQSMGSQRVGHYRATD